VKFRVLCFTVLRSSHFRISRSQPYGADFSEMNFSTATRVGVHAHHGIMSAIAILQQLRKCLSKRSCVSFLCAALRAC
jgi:hypothetical protein